MITAHYAALFPPLSADQLHALSAQDAALGFRAANMAHFYSLDEHHLAQMRAYFERLSQLGAVSASQLQDMAGAYIASRHWQQARALREAFPATTMAPVPWVIDTVQGQITVPASVLSIGPTAGQRSISSRTASCCARWKGGRKQGASRNCLRQHVPSTCEQCAGHQSQA